MTRERSYVVSLDRQKLFFPLLFGVRIDGYRSIEEICENRSFWLGFLAVNRVCARIEEILVKCVAVFLLFFFGWGGVLMS